MKKIALTILACAAICACDKEASVTKDVSQQTFDGGVAYLTVNIKDVNTSTRASNGGFAYGTTAEQTVSNAHFYFYDDSGNYMAQGSLGSVSGEAGTTESIEWGSNTVVAVWGLTEDGGFLTKMVTVLNEPANFSGAHKSLNEMTAALSEATNGWNSGSASSPSFVMSTSVYTSGGAVVNYTTLTEDDFSLEPIDISSDYPDGGVEVYVERLAAKVGVSLANEMLDGPSGSALSVEEVGGVTYYNVGDVVGSGLQSTLDGPLYLGILGWDLNGTSRDSYMLKNISDNANWNNLTFVWNGSTDFRCYWAESPNYGVSVEYPTTSDGNTDDDEDITPLNEYLRYTSLASPIEFGNYGYCAENTNTTGVLVDALSNGITNVLVKAQAGTITDDGFTPIDLIEYKGGYYTAEDFLNQCVSDVVNYDFTVLVDEVITALDNEYPELSDYLDELNEAIIHDAVYVSEAITDHKVTSTNKPESVSKFDGSLLSLYNLNDGKVDIFFNGAEQYYGEDGDDTGTQVEPTLCGKYKEEDIVYGGESMDDYEFYFHVDYDKLSTATRLGTSLISLIVSIDGEYYLPLDNSFYITTENAFKDESWTGNHTYTLRNFFLRAITVEADGIDAEFGSYYPHFYNQGLMYYAIPVEHLGGSTTSDFVEGQYGIVRNHWYDITINYIAGLGYGIADEDEVIVPQPVETYYYLGADVNILSWTMITQTSGLGPRN